MAKAFALRQALDHRHLPRGLITKGRKQPGQAFRNPRSCLSPGGPPSAGYARPRQRGRGLAWLAPAPEPWKGSAILLAAAPPKRPGEGATPFPSARPAPQKVRGPNAPGARKTALPRCHYPRVIRVGGAPPPRPRARVAPRRRGEGPHQATAPRQIRSSAPVAPHPWACRSARATGRSKRAPRLEDPRGRDSP